MDEILIVLEDDNQARLVGLGDYWRVETGPDTGVLIPTNQRPLVVGTVQNRHDLMDCDVYIHDKKVREFGQPIFDITTQIFTSLCEKYPNVTIHLKYTGITEITLAAVLTLLYCGIDFTILHWDSKTKCYNPLDSGMIDSLIEKGKAGNG